MAGGEQRGRDGSRKLLVECLLPRVRSDGQSQSEAQVVGVRPTAKQMAL